MTQQLYLNRAAVCIAMQLTNRDMITAAHRAGIKGAATANLGDYLVLRAGEEHQMVSAAMFQETWARPDSLLAPHDSELVQGLAKLSQEPDNRRACYRCGYAYNVGRKICPECGEANPLATIAAADALIAVAQKTAPIPAAKTKRRLPRRGRKRCPDCGKVGESVGHQDCQFPQNHD